MADLSPLTVLLVEDHPGDAAITRAAMESALDTVRVIVCGSGEAALTWLNACAPQDLPRLILADVHLPEMSGIDLGTSLRGTPHLKQIPIFLFSALINPREKEEALKGGASGFFEKPLDYYESVEFFTRLFSDL